MIFTKIINIVLIPDCLQLLPTFGGMWRWRPDASGRWRAVPRTERREVGVFFNSWCDAGLSV